jgi:hypothetical protein
MHLEQYKCLEVRMEQERAMAHLWARIKPRRNALNAQYASIARAIAAIPSAACVPDALALTIAELCQSHAARRAGAAVTRTRVKGCDVSDVNVAEGPRSHKWARHVLGSSAAATAAASSALERLWETLVNESDSQNAMTGLAYNAPCLSHAQVARFLAVTLTHSGTVEADMFRMCQLAAQKLWRDRLFELQFVGAQVV